MLALFPLTGTITLVGLGAVVYGTVTLSPVMFVEGLFLTYTGLYLTVLAVGD
jgi:hypothetical protein